MSNIFKSHGKHLPRLSVRELTNPLSITAGDIDRYSALLITTSSAKIYTLPTPSISTLKRILYVIHNDDSTGSLEVNGVDINVGSHIMFFWDGDFWHVQEVTGVSSGITAPQHRALDQLVHNIAENSFDEIVRSGNQVTDVITWESAAKLLKIRESNFTYSGNKVTTIVTKQYDGLGSIVETLTETISYTGNQVDDITRVLT